MPGRGRGGYVGERKGGGVCAGERGGRGGIGRGEDQGGIRGKE